MTRILILESETPEVLSEYGNSLATAYGEALQRIDADIGFRVASPYSGEFGSSRRELSAPLRDTELRNWLSQIADRQRLQRKAG